MKPIVLIAFVLCPTMHSMVDRLRKCMEGRLKKYIMGMVMGSLIV